MWGYAPRATIRPCSWPNPGASIGQETEGNFHVQMITMGAPAAEVFTLAFPARPLRPEVSTSGIAGIKSYIGNGELSQDFGGIGKFQPEKVGGTLS